MKQRRFAFLLEKFMELSVILERKIEGELVACMAEAILEVYKKGGIKADDRNSEKQ